MFFKDLERYRTHNKAAMSQLAVSSQDNQRLEQEVQNLRKELAEIHRQREVLLAENGNSDSLFMLSHHSDDYDSLRKRYEELLVSHNQAIEKLELAQDETNRVSKQCDDLSQERNNAVRLLNNSIEMQINTDVLVA